MTNLSKEQYEHYLLAGCFTATYSPKKDDISEQSKSIIGNEIEVYPNMVMHPSDSPNFLYQLQFNSNSIQGWIPEEDLSDLKIIQKFINSTEFEHTYYKNNKKYPPCYMYKLEYSTYKQVFENFGVGFESPLTVNRHYNSEVDGYIMNLSTAQADTIHKAVWIFGEQLKWKQIL